MPIYSIWLQNIGVWRVSPDCRQNRLSGMNLCAICAQTADGRSFQPVAAGNG